MFKREAQCFGVVHASRHLHQATNVKGSRLWVAADQHHQLSDASGVTKLKPDVCIRRRTAEDPDHKVGLPDSCSRAFKRWTPDVREVLKYRCACAQLPQGLAERFDIDACAETNETGRSTHYGYRLYHANPTAESGLPAERRLSA